MLMRDERALSVFRTASLARFMFIIIKLSEIYDPADPMRDSGQGSRSFPSERCKSRELEAEIGANERGESYESEIKERLRLQIIYSRYHF